jgi:hypothetical protein
LRRTTGRAALLVLAAAGCWLLLSRFNPRIVAAVAHTPGTDGPVALHGPQPYVLASSPQHGATLALTLEYRPGQNATLGAEPLYECLPRRFRVNGKWAAFAATTSNRVCSYAVVDLSRHLKPGLNRLEFDVPRSGRPSAIYVGPVLLGTHFLSTLAGLGLCAVAAAALLWVTRRLGLPVPTRVVMAAALCYFLFWLHYHPNLTYTNDLLGHISYTRYMVDGWQDP